MTMLSLDDVQSLNLTQQIEAAIKALPVKTAETMAKAVHAILRKAATEEGQNPDIEVLIRRPGEPRHFDNADCWCVAWEAGPWEWAIPASFAICDAADKLCEPYYSFDLCFYPAEDR